MRGLPSSPIDTATAPSISPTSGWWPSIPLSRMQTRTFAPVEPPQADSEQAVREFTQRCTDVLEMYVRRHPALWLWMHRRWRDAEPSLEGIPGMFPAAERD